MALKRAFLIFAAAAAGISVYALAASADDSGMAGIHDWKRVGSKTCFSDHRHVGNSSGFRSQRQALSAAIKDWQEFTAFEYGTDWAYFHRANARLKSCSKDTSGWGCTVEATPCKR
jgi:hypothetical protein